MFLSKINFKHPKYAIPAIIYIPVLLTAYAVFDLFDTEIQEVDQGMETTEYLNSKLPGATIKDDGIGNRYDNMKKSFGRIQDLSAVDNIERHEDKQFEEYHSQYTEEERRLLEEEATRRSEELDHFRQMQEAIANSAEKGEGMVSSEAEKPTTDEERLARAQLRQDEAMEELNKALAEARLSGHRTVQEAMDSTKKSVVTSTEKIGTIIDDGIVKGLDEASDASEVIRVVRNSSDYFNTIAENEKQPHIIKAIIDEDITASDGSRVRLRLLDDISINDIILPKGAYLYAIMSGFATQRVKGAVQSILIEDELIKVNLSIYDMDGLEGLYIPQDRFRETAKNVGAGAMGGSMSLNSSGTSSDMVRAWGLTALNNAYQKTTNAVSGSIKKNKAKLKYGSQVFLVNGREKKK